MSQILSFKRELVTAHMNTYDYLNVVRRSIATNSYTERPPGKTLSAEIEASLPI